MGLLNNLFQKKQLNEQVKGYFKTLNAYTPIFTSFSGGVYEMELTRACIHAFATQASKLKPEVSGARYADLNNVLQFKPNPYMDTTKFIYRLATILEAENNAFIVPLYRDKFADRIAGFYPLHPMQTELRTRNGNDLYLTYTFPQGQRASIEWERVGVLNKFFYKDDFFGMDNRALYPTMQLMDTNNQAIVEAVKQSATLRFMARLANVFKPADIQAERERFASDNLSANNTTGVLMFDNKYAEVKQIESQPFVVDADQMKQIKENCFSYFGCNEHILNNQWTENEWNAYYEGKLEPFALQLSLVLSNMCFSERELAFGNRITFTANRLQYATNESKLKIVSQLFDRGMLTQNQGREIFNMKPEDSPEADKYYIRKEYAEKENLNEAQGIEGSTEGAENDAN